MLYSLYALTKNARGCANMFKSILALVMLAMALRSDAVVQITKKFIPTCSSNTCCMSSQNYGFSSSAPYNITVYFPRQNTYLNTPSPYRYLLVLIPQTPFNANGYDDYLIALAQKGNSIVAIQLAAEDPSIQQTRVLSTMTWLTTVEQRQISAKSDCVGQTLGALQVHAPIEYITMGTIQLGTAPKFGILTHSTVAPVALSLTTVLTGGNTWGPMIIASLTLINPVDPNKNGNPSWAPTYSNSVPLLVLNAHDSAQTVCSPCTDSMWTSSCSDGVDFITSESVRPAYLVTFSTMDENDFVDFGSMGTTNPCSSNTAQVASYTSALVASTNNFVYYNAATGIPTTYFTDCSALASVSGFSGSNLACQTFS